MLSSIFPPTPLRRTSALLPTLPEPVLARILDHVAATDLGALARLRATSTTMLHHAQHAIARYLSRGGIPLQLHWSLAALGSGATDAPLSTVPMRVVAVHPDAELCVLEVDVLDGDQDVIMDHDVDRRVAQLALDIVQTSTWWCLRMTLEMAAPVGVQRRTGVDPVHRHRLIDYTHTGPYSPSCDEMRVLSMRPTSLAPTVAPSTLSNVSAAAAARLTPHDRRLIEGPAVLGTPCEVAFRSTIYESFTATHRVLDVTQSRHVVSWTHLFRLLARGSTAAGRTSRPRPVVADARKYLGDGWMVANGTPLAAIDAAVRIVLPTLAPPGSPTISRNVRRRNSAATAAVVPLVRSVALMDVDSDVDIEGAASKRACPDGAMAGHVPVSAPAVPATGSLTCRMRATAAGRGMPAGAVARLSGWRKLTDVDSVQLHRASHF
ncbi:hypothetical protein AMAG_19232 [Allomyces macrogynus ATCC 38327]|uniref:F-box domain-containing protein n=1 Tax=Allomyces macrogynus (strain ATCC 38327) TaxID=578462 RepID=A0A0L0SU01_ALLM3|nr:hypothetical protein AMAG_19232 [Allomyces macrogynus ATCC 38327]|eukprot:KNE65885.1 hypothetical protein AMAG_19232 [Allomyces macrogynus ATCC 38327]